MGLKWEYELAFPGMLNPDKIGVSGHPTLVSKHWDSNAFHGFVPADAEEKLFDNQILFCGHEDIQGNLRLDTVTALSGEDMVKSIELAIQMMIINDVRVGVVVLPHWIYPERTVQAMGEVARRAVWNRYPDSKLLNLRFVCPTQEIFDSANKYFQGTWELP